MSTRMFSEEQLAQLRGFLAGVGRRATNQALERREDDRRYPILLALVAQSAVDQLDEVVSLFDQGVSARESRARTRTEEALVERAKRGEARQLLMDVILPVLADPAIPDEQVGGLLRDRIGMSRLREVAAGGGRPLPRDHGRLSALVASFAYLRQFTPQVLTAIDFQGGPGTDALMEAGRTELHTALSDLETTLAAAAPDDTGAVRLDEDDALVIPRLTAEDIPAEAKALREELAGMLPFAPIASLLIELDVRTGFLGCFTHAGGRKQSQSIDLKRNILAVLIAQATNLGLARMSQACGVAYDVLAWTAEWYVREDTLREANTVIVNHHHGLDLSGVFGGGTMSSSDGQRFPVRGKSTTARETVIHGGQVLSTYTQSNPELVTTDAGAAP